MDTGRLSGIDDDTSDSDTSFDRGSPIAAAAKKKVSRDDSNSDEKGQERRKKDKNSSRLSNRLKNVVSESEDSYGSPMPTTKQRR